MAWLERKGTLFRIRFRFGGKKRLVVLKTDNEKEAATCLARFDENLRLAERGRLEILADADVGVFLLSDGKLNHRPLEERRERQKVVTLGEMFAGYRESYPKRAKEASTLYTERIHMAHLERIIGANVPLHSVTAKTLQDYVVTRSKERSRFDRTIGSRTIKKEIGNFTAVWNQWAVPQGLASGRAPTGALNFDKERAKPPFQTREQIERQIARGGLSVDEEEALWDCLFLTLPEIGDVLDYVHRKSARLTSIPSLSSLRIQEPGGVRCSGRE